MAELFDQKGSFFFVGRFHPFISCFVLCIGVLACDGFDRGGAISCGDAFFGSTSAASCKVLGDAFGLTTIKSCKVLRVYDVRVLDQTKVVNAYVS